MNRKNLEKHSLTLSVLVVLLGLLLVVASGCSSKNKSASESELTEAGLSESDLNMQREGRFADGSVPMAEGEGLFRDISFSYDSSDINDTARQNIEYNVTILQSNPAIRLQLEGHCDERGTAEYNLALGERRARAVYDLLVSFGIDASRLETISYGEEVPLDPSPTESAYGRNRRVHFSAFTR